MFEKVKKNFGFGCMRLPMIGEEVDLKEFTKMVDEFMGEGFNYFDTAHGYLSGKSELVIGECLSSRYDRESFVLVNKLSGNFFKTNEEIRPLFEEQLRACKVDYFDLYLMHAQTANAYAHFRKNQAYETALELKKEGKIKHFGISFHDTAKVLDQILTDYPEIEFVQLQINYLDYDDPAVQGGLCYEVCCKHNKPVIVMEPVKGGHLVNLPQTALEIIQGLKGGSPASYAIRYAASFPQVKMVLSGMSNMEQMADNLNTMRDFKPLTVDERENIEKVKNVFRAKNFIQCTACRYCVDGCPQKISIPDLFACMNTDQAHKDWNASYYYSIHTKSGGKASDCISCGKCERICPQHLPIRALLKDIAKTFEK